MYTPLYSFHCSVGRCYYSTYESDGISILLNRVFGRPFFGITQSMCFSNVDKTGDYPIAMVMQLVVLLKGTTMIDWKMTAPQTGDDMVNIGR